MEDEVIRVTHFVNPHLFFYKPVSAYLRNSDEKRFQIEVDEYCEDHFRPSDSREGVQYDAFQGELVAVMDFDRNKWRRCVVDQIVEDGTQEKRYNLWAIDDGVPLQAFSRDIVPLPEHLSSDVTVKVKRGAIKNILPSERIYDCEEDELVSRVTEKWDRSAIDVLRSVIQSAESIHFRNVTKHHVSGRGILTYFGDLEIVTRKGNRFHAVRVLEDLCRATATEPREFLQRLAQIQTVNESRCLVHDGIDNSKKPTKHISKTNSVESVAKRDIVKQPNILDINGVSEHDFDESASMIMPNTVRQNAQKSHAPEVIYSDEEQYPISLERPTTNGHNDKYEQELWEKPTRPPTHETITRLQNLKLNGHNSFESSVAGSKLDDSYQKPKSATRSKLDMLKKAKAAAKHQPEPERKSQPTPAVQTQYDGIPSPPKQQKEPESKSPPPAAMSRYGGANIFPAGFNMGNISYSNGQMVASSSSESARHNKKVSPNMKPRQSAASKPAGSQTANKQKMNGPIDGGRRFSNGGASSSAEGESSGKVYMTKNTSRFDQFVEEEACIRSKLSEQRLLVHGKRIPKPVESLESANFCQEVHKQLDTLHFGSLRRIQTYGWPHILRGNSFFCVNSAETGKTFTYLPAICSLIMKIHDEGLAPRGAGPVAIVVCKSSREVQRVASYAKQMLCSSQIPSMVVVEAYGARDIPKVCNQLLNSCALLVTTAPTYRRVYESMPNALDLERIQAVVIDDIDHIIQRFGPELQMLCKNCNKPELQMVVTATYWNALFLGFLKRYKNMIICIGAYLEAAVYGRSELVLKLQTESSKMNEVISFLREHNYLNERTIVVCSGASEVYQIVEQLKSQSITHMYCIDVGTMSQMDGFKEWDNKLPGEMPVLVCDDAMMVDLAVCKAQHIIHYSLANTWTNFTRRFACSFGYYTNPFNSDSAGKAPSSSLILLDENNNEQLPRLVKFLQIHNHEMAEAVVKLANNIRIRQEEQKLASGNPIDFCPQVLEFGKCRNNGCTKRHVFTTRDLAVDNVLSTGIIKMKIFNIFSPTHYAVRVLEHRDYGARGWTKVNDSQHFFALDLSMQKHYANEDRHCSHGEVSYNDWCVIYDEHRYWRCRILSMEPKRENASSRRVKVKLLDVGRTLDCMSSELLHMPEEFRKLPAQAIDVRIVGVVPHDFETEWDKRVTATVKAWIEKYTARDEFHTEGKVLLAVKDTIWVDTIRLVEHLTEIKTEIHEINVKSEIVGNKNFGVAENEPLELLTRMVDDCEAFRKKTNLDSASNEGGMDDVDEELSSASAKDVRSKPEDFFPQDSKRREIDKPTPPPKGLLKPAEMSSADSEDSDCEVGKNAQTTQNVPEKGDNSRNDQKTKTESQPKRDFVEIYDELQNEEKYEVYISQYYAPDDFYVCRVELFTTVTETISKFTQTETNLLPLGEPLVGEYCLVLYDNAYQRAKITQVDSRDIRVFFLDLGGYDTYAAIDLFQLPTELLKASPFCAIKGGMACLLPREGEGYSWSQEVGDRIYDEVLATFRTFGTTVIERYSAAATDTLVKCNSYRLLLFDLEHDQEESWICDEIVERQLARYIESERPFTVDFCNFDEGFAKFFKPNNNEDAPARQDLSEDDVSEPRFEEIVEPANHSKSAEASAKPPPSSKVHTKLALLKQRMRRKKSTKSLSYPRLKCAFKSPKTIWRQDASMVVIRVVAPEYVKYDLAIDADSVKLCYVDNDDKYLLSLNLFAAIRPDHAIHEVRGLSIMIRLVKLVHGMQWPSLMRHGDKVPWLQQCIEVPNSDETDNTDSLERALSAVPNLDLSSDDSLTDEPEFNDQFDRFDPIEDDYFLRD